MKKKKIIISVGSSTKNPGLKENKGKCVMCGGPCYHTGRGVRFDEIEKGQVKYPKPNVFFCIECFMEITNIVIEVAKKKEQIWKTNH